MKTYNEVYIAARNKLKAAGIDAYALEARLIAEYASGKTREEYMTDGNLYAGAGFEEKIMELIERRVKEEPVAYITGEWEFYSLPMNVTPDVLIPRMDSELLADKAIELLKSCGGQLRVMDLCCGSGCIGIAIASEVPGCRMVFVDESAKVLSVCRSNLARNTLTRIASCVEADALAAPPMAMGQFDMIVCNPPYIPSADIMGLDTSVWKYEPITALDGGKDGLDFYRSISSKWKCILRKGGALFFECGIGQSGDVADILKANGFEAVAIYKDTLGIERVVAGVYTGGKENGR